MVRAFSVGVLVSPLISLVYPGVDPTSRNYKRIHVINQLTFNTKKVVFQSCFFSSTAKGGWDFIARQPTNQPGIQLNAQLINQ